VKLVSVDPARTRVALIDAGGNLQIALRLVGSVAALACSVAGPMIGFAIGDHLHLEAI
jgi:hypothetical protein